MSGAHRPAVEVAHVGRLLPSKTVPRYCQLDPSRVRAMCMRPEGSPALSGSEVAYAYHQPSRPRITDGSANVSENESDTAFSYAASRCALGAAPAPTAPAGATAVMPTAATSAVRRAVPR